VKDREVLDRLSREALLDLLARQAEVIRRQQEELPDREAAIERRDEKIRALEEELVYLRRPVKTPENSSIPPSRGQKPNLMAGRRSKLGPKRGHVGSSRVRSEPDVVVKCRPRRTFGPGVEALLSYLHERRHVGYERLVELCR
jgi:transposase